MARFLRDGADVNYTTDGFRTPLLLAIIGSKDNMIEFLIINGADLNMMGRDEDTIPICVALRDPHQPCVPLLLHHIALSNAKGKPISRTIEECIRKYSDAYEEFEDSRDFLQDLEGEIVHHNHRTTFFDILLLPPHTLARRLRCADIREAFESGLWGQYWDGVMYNREIERKYDCALRHLRQLREAEEKLGDIFNGRVPALLLRNIIDKLPPDQVKLFG